MRSLASLHESRTGSPLNFRPPVQKDFCNNICHKQTSARLFDHLVGAAKQRLRYFEPEQDDFFEATCRTITQCFDFPPIA